MMSGDQQYLPETYFDELAGALTPEDLEVDLSPPQILYLTARDTYSNREQYDARHGAALAAAGGNPLRRFLDRFAGARAHVRAEVSTLYDLYRDARQWVQDHDDVVGIILSGGTVGAHDVNSLLLDYLVLGRCKTRVGGEIVLPGDESGDKTLHTLLGMFRIWHEDSWSRLRPDLLPWLADVEGEEARRFRHWESEAGDFGDRLASSMGRAAAVGATGILNPIVKLPDEVTVAVAFIAGVQGRKVAELKMHQYLVENPDAGWDIPEEDAE
jgi:hypothetical protein